MNSVRIPRLEILFWWFLATGVIALNVSRYGGPFISNDGVQYLSVAENIAAGRGIRTSIVHFDVERAHGEIPAPSTTFPPGYSTVVALLSLTGLSAERAGLLCSATAFLALISLIRSLAAWFELTALATRFVWLAMVLNYVASIQSSKTESESLFTLLTMGGVFFMFQCAAQVQADPSEPPGVRWRDWLVAGLLIGSAYWVRYAGLFLFVAAVLLAGSAVWLLPRRHAAKPFAAIAVAASMVAVLFWRNIVYTGSWKGGNTKEVVNPLLGFLKLAIATVYQLFLGNLVLDRIGVLEVVFALGALAAGVVVLLQLGRIVRDPQPRRRVPIALVVTGAFVGVYTAAFLYLGLFSVISFSAKMFYPILPLLLLLLAWVLSETWKHASQFLWPRRALVGGLAAILLSYCLLNIRDTLGSRTTEFASISEYQRIAKRFEAPTPRGETLRSWFEQNVPAGDPIVSSSGQSTAYALRRRAVSLVSSEYSDFTWSEAAIRQVMDTFHSDVLILYPGTGPGSDAVQEESEFLSALLHGEIPPWLTVAAENTEVTIFQRVGDDSQSAQAVPSHPTP